MQTETDIVASVLSLLASKVGLCPEVLGYRAVEIALKRIAVTRGMPLHGVWSEIIKGPGPSWTALIDYVTVPETWFLRHPEAFSLLADFARTDFLPSHRSIRILSCPCATGEEPYSIALTLIDTGFSPDLIRVDAIDIAQSWIKFAIAGSYSLRSLREQGSEFILNHASRAHNTFQFLPAIRSLIRFRQANILEIPAENLASHYHVVFCRNLLIYLTPKARESLIDKLHAALVADGILFTSYAEHSLLKARFRRLPVRHAFAYAKSSITRESRPPTQNDVSEPQIESRIDRYG